MSMAHDIAWGLARSGVIAAAAVLVGHAACRVLASMPRRVGRVAWAAVLIPYLTPVLLVGYAWSRYSLSLIRYPAWNELLYAALVWLKLTPVAALVLWFAPSPMSPEALWCYKLSRKRMGGGVDGWMNVRATQSSDHPSIYPFLHSSPLVFWLRSSGRAVAVAFVAVFLLAFGEFEMASLLGVRSWTVTLFDAQVGGLALSESLRRVAPSAACEAVLLLLIFALLASSPGGRVQAKSRHGVGRPTRVAVSLYLFAALAAVAAVPMWAVLKGTFQGFALLGESLALTRDVLASVLFGMAGTACAYGISDFGFRISDWKARKSAIRNPQSAIMAALCAPGLLGALVLSLALLWLFQRPVLRAAFDTPVPLVAALTLLLVPFALLLRLLLAAVRPGEAVHAAALLGESSDGPVVRAGRRVLWRLHGQGKFMAAFLLFCWGYFDMTASAILAPSQMTPVWVRLYNFMHYGQTAALSAMVFVAFAVPFLLLALFFASFRAFRG